MSYGPPATSAAEGFVGGAGSARHRLARSRAAEARGTVVPPAGADSGAARPRLRLDEHFRPVPVSWHKCETRSRGAAHHRWGGLFERRASAGRPAPRQPDDHPRLRAARGRPAWHAGYQGGSWSATFSGAANYHGGPPPASAATTAGQYPGTGPQPPSTASSMFSQGNIRPGQQGAAARRHTASARGENGHGGWARVKADPSLGARARGGAKRPNGGILRVRPGLPRCSRWPRGSGPRALAQRPRVPVSGSRTDCRPGGRARWRLSRAPTSTGGTAGGPRRVCTE